MIVTVDIPTWLYDIAVFAALVYRRIRYGYPFRRIHLSQGRFARVDPEDYEWLMQYKWHITEVRRIVYARRSIRCPRTRKISARLMHREIMKAPEGLVVDHINFNGLDNRKANLRLATHAQNDYHRRKPKNSRQSIYKGVYRAKGKKPWRAAIRYKRRSIYLGHFKEEVEAARAYDRAARKYHGEFAALNLPESATKRHKRRRGQKTEDRGQRAEGGRQRTEDRFTAEIAENAEKELDRDSH